MLKDTLQPLSAPFAPSLFHAHILILNTFFSESHVTVPPF